MQEKENNAIEDFDYDPKPIPLEEWRKNHPESIYIMTDGFYKWINGEYVRINPKDDFVSE